MSDPLRKTSAAELRDKLRALARTANTSDPNELARLAKDAGVNCTAEEIKAVIPEIPSDFGEDDLERVAGGLAPHQGYDYSANRKV